MNLQSQFTELVSFSRPENDCMIQLSSAKPSTVGCHLERFKQGALRSNNIYVYLSRCITC